MNRIDLVKAFAKGWILDVGCGDAVFVWGGSPHHHHRTWFVQTSRFMDTRT